MRCTRARVCVCVCVSGGSEGHWRRESRQGPRPHESALKHNGYDKRCACVCVGMRVRVHWSNFIQGGGPRGGGGRGARTHTDTYRVHVLLVDLHLLYRRGSDWKWHRHCMADGLVCCSRHGGGGEGTFKDAV